MLAETFAPETFVEIDVGVAGVEISVDLEIAGDGVLTQFASVVLGVAVETELEVETGVLPQFV